MLKPYTKLNDVDEEATSALVSYLCLRTSGYLETSVMMIIREYVEEMTREELPYIANYLSDRLDFTFNPWPSAVLELLGKFNVDWKDKIKFETRGNISEQVEAIVLNRNKIAHGEDVNLVP